MLAPVPVFGVSLAAPRIVSHVIRYARSTAVSLLGAATLSGCAATGPLASGDTVPTAAAEPSVAATAPGSAGPAPAVTVTVSAVPTTVVTITRSAKSPATEKTSKAHTPDGPRVQLRIARAPKCAEGTAVFRAEPVPLVLTWKITGATGGALSVDDATTTPGTYGEVDLEGSMEFRFSCSGEVGSTETHTYALYTVGGGPQRSATVTASATVLDNGLGTE